MASRGPQRMAQSENRATQRGAGDASSLAAANRAVRPPAPQKNNPLPIWRRLPVILGAATGVGLCGILLLASFLFAHVQPAPADPTPVARTLCAHLQTQDYAATYAQLSARLRAEGTVTQFSASQRRLDIQRGTVTSCVPKVEHADAAQSTVSLTLARGASTPQTASVTLIYESGAWAVDAYDPALI